MKEVPCPICQGYGFNSKFTEDCVWSERCQNCDGTGIVKAPTTNADRIRAMSDHDLAVFLEHAMYDSSEPDWMTVLSWLQQPAEEET